MKILTFKEKYEHGGKRTTLFKEELSLDKIESLQILKLTLDLKEPFHVNKHGNVVCFVIDGWMEVTCNDKNFRLEENQAVLFEQDEKHKILRGEGLMLSISSEHYEKSLGTIWE